MPASEKQRQLCETTQLQICLASLSGVFQKIFFIVVNIQTASWLPLYNLHGDCVS